jgi:hypothetical protein
MRETGSGDPLRPRSAPARSDAPRWLGVALRHGGSYRLFQYHLVVGLRDVTIEFRVNGAVYRQLRWLDQAELSYDEQPIDLPSVPKLGGD